MRKKKFSPVISRIKLNPEQAVLLCCVSISQPKIANTDTGPCQPEGAICLSISGSYIEQAYT